MAAETPTKARPIQPKTEKFSFTLGKLDAGMAVLIGPNAHVLEFPSRLLPTPSVGDPPLGPGSVFTITVARDLDAERQRREKFVEIQETILEAYGTSPPSKPVIKLLNVTQTSVALEWEELQLGSADLLSLEMYRNGQRWGRIGSDFGTKNEKREWKTGGLQSGEEYTFQLVLKTTSGTFHSHTLRVRTHTMDNLTGLYVTFGTIEPSSLAGQLRRCLEEIGAREASGVQLATTHFVCTSPLLSSSSPTPGIIDPDYQSAMKANLPVVGPAWLLAVAAERRLVPIANYLLPAPSAAPQYTDGSVPLFRRPSDMKRSSLPVGTPAQEHPMRSPSPETLARMSKTGPAMSPSSRTGSFENRRLSQPQLPSEVVADEERAASPVRSRSPRPEADGRLDRGFRFPVGSPSGNGVGAHGRVKEIRTNIKDSDLSPQPSPKIQTPIVHIQAPSTDGPMSAPVGYTPDETESVKEEDEEDEETADPEPTSKSTETTDVTPAEDPAPADLPPSYAEFSPAESPLPDAKDAKTDATIADDSNAEASPTDGGDDGALDEIEL